MQPVTARKQSVRYGLSLATLMGLEPTTSCVTGRRSNQLSYSATSPYVFTTLRPATLPEKHSRRGNRRHEAAD